MYFREVARILGRYLSAFSIALLIPLFLAAYYQFVADPQTHPQPHSTWAFLSTIGICLLSGALLIFWGRNAPGHLYWREGLIVVVSVWLSSPLIGGLPFYFSGTLDHPLHAYFEAVSGFTTTGATVMSPKAYDGVSGEEIMIEQSESQILTTKYLFYGTISPVRDPQTGAILYSGIEAVGKALLYWRSLMQWLGGVGIVVLFIAVLPALGVGGKVLLHAEMPGPIKDSLTPRIKETAIHLSKIYLGLTLAQILILRFTNSDVGWFEAMTITFSTISTGGFTIRNQSIGGLQSAHTDWVVILFMLMGATNFSLYFHILRGRIYKIYDAEFIVYMIIVLCCGVYASYSLYDTPKMLLNGMIEGTYSLSEAVRHGTFQMVSAQTSTGFVTQNFDFWPFSVQWLMIMVMFFGGMSGSTSGGMKIVRLNMLFLILQNKVESLFRPQAVRKLHVGTREVDTGVAITLLCFFLVLTFFTYFGTFWLINNQIDPETAFTVTICMINNIGIAFRAAGPTESFAFLPNNCLIMSCIWMLLGRLEFFALLVVLVPGFWREN